MNFVDFINENSRFSEIVRLVAMHLRLYYPYNKYILCNLPKHNH